MKITKRQLRKIIREGITHRLVENTITPEISSYDGVIMGAEDASGEFINLGNMVAALLDAGKSEIFHPSGKNDKALQHLMNARVEARGGPLENWDGDVFSSYYDVDNAKVVELYAGLIGAALQEPVEDVE